MRLHSWAFAEVAIIAQWLTFEAILGTAASREEVPPEVRNGLHPLSRLHDEGAGNIRTHALVKDAAVVHPVLDQDGVLGTAVWLCWTGALDAIAL